MLPSHNARVIVATRTVDFRKGHDGFAALTQSVLKEDTFTGAVLSSRPDEAIAGRHPKSRIDELLPWHFTSSG